MFQKLVSFTKKVADLSDKPSLNPAELKAQFDAAPDEVRESLNKLIDALQKTETGDSGAKNIGVTNISGLTGTDVQTLLEALANNKVNKAGDILSGPLRFADGSATIVMKQPGKKSFVIHHPAEDKLVITASITADAEDWDWANQYVFTANGVFTAPGGLAKIGKTPAFTWTGTIANNNYVDIVHNLGYKPIVQLDGTTGNIQMNTAHINVNTTRISCYSTGGNSWTGTISFY
jgi:hypothetical protein